MYMMGICAHVYGGLQRLEESVRAYGIGIISYCELPYLTIEPSLQPLKQNS